MAISGSPSTKPQTPPGNADAWVRSFSHFASDIKLAHSIFAIPFALSAFIVADLPLPGWRDAAFLLICMISARSFAMGMNRYIDRYIDGSNPRTLGRAIPSGRLTPGQGLAWSMIWASIFVVAAFSLNSLAGICSLPLLVILAGYSYLKRFSWMVHWYLGVCLGLSPLAVSVALVGQISLPVLLIGISVTMWTAGFDILYSLQDMSFDRSQGLHSVPSKFGPSRALWISRLCFVAMVIGLVICGLMVKAGGLYFFGVALVAAVLFYEHYLVRDARQDGTSKNINVAFFNANASVSIIFYLFAQLDVFFPL